MNRIINFFLVGIKYFFKALFVGIFAIFIAGLFIIFIQELFWLLGYFGFTDFAVAIIDVPFYILATILTKSTGLEIDGLFAAFGATIIFAMPTLIMYIFIFLFILLELTIGLEIDDPFTGLGVGIILAIPTLIVFIFILIIFAKITMKFLDNFKNKTYSKSFYFIVFLFFNYIYLFIFLGFKKSLYLTLISHYSKFFEFSNENLLFLVLAFCLGLISTYLTKIKFFKGEKYV
ncbi:MAG: hypothetical protein SPJ69_06390 [Campylobacter sp.]|uniref:hypothetical protein n=1 Tax=Campylobacter sp. TaxID=205 RepID=UPI00297A6C10|nr:hypothetical protein [Campylobacter sp.]MDD7600461.1 hypothetical protein [Campylobacteraceae bacterium]MDY5887931.1 hypothetical protein [Campylobacter sp.]